MLAAAGLDHPSQLSAKHLVRRMSATEIKLFSQLHVFLKPGELLTGEVNGEFYSRMWQMARADSFEPQEVDTRTCVNNNNGGGGKDARTSIDFLRFKTVRPRHLPHPRIELAVHFPGEQLSRFQEHVQL